MPEHEVTLTFVRSGGSGGQKVNKTSSKAELHWHVGRSGSFSAEEKALIREKLKVSKDDEIILQCDEERSQSQNKAACIERLHQKAHEAIQVPEERVETHVPKGIKKKNADSDFREARKKACRKKVDW
ncbi:hypothetical protein A2348_04730 [Candidatus Uhrbacteria bacterium RIFOXYB12_FULL_58_10]|uniref:Prokaryotic-type class I peptide chain release factors domain-containing protein n=1 Tax=Candidatus Uhrbacteria bacterium RIFOXYB2_FULL_57_15 TaxID=1802422 RepID=A0A1F7W8S1_9BACT|nr:MAG: hypothetical protein A2348_04730 [Candidatus Uhrbacteria bacterium RIFOXYB12_FULL_58_10]OGL98987.1 MAG: hypothetical protein A2501_02540 [Candidatus Uhrbacteria bacterium RIFOXYC12_FULL_57_11]OGL99159.1 MAG: hypothetical protein A2304_03260 [Candidatus Uhrbacteria bacterium RIFOXYB2_FULL_57_15]